MSFISIPVVQTVRKMDYYGNIMVNESGNLVRTDNSTRYIDTKDIKALVFKTDSIEVLSTGSTKSWSYHDSTIDSDYPVAVITTVDKSAIQTVSNELLKDSRFVEVYAYEDAGFARTSSGGFDGIPSVDSTKLIKFIINMDLIKSIDFHSNNTQSTVYMDYHRNIIGELGGSANTGMTDLETFKPAPIFVPSASDTAKLYSFVTNKKDNEVDLGPINLRMQMLETYVDNLEKRIEYLTEQLHKPN